MTPDIIDELRNTYKAYEASERLIKSYQSELINNDYTPEVNVGIERKLMFEKNKLAVYDATIHILFKTGPRYSKEDLLMISMIDSPISITLRPGSESEKMLGRTIIARPIFSNSDIAEISNSSRVKFEIVDYHSIKTKNKLPQETANYIENIGISVSDIIEII